jgi:hypothetical protein
MPGRAGVCSLSGRRWPGVVGGLRRFFPPAARTLSSVSTGGLPGTTATSHTYRTCSAAAMEARTGAAILRAARPWGRAAAKGRAALPPLARQHVALCCMLRLPQFKLWWDDAADGVGCSAVAVAFGRRKSWRCSSSCRGYADAVTIRCSRAQEINAGHRQWRLLLQDGAPSVSLACRKKGGGLFE